MTRRARSARCARPVRRAALLLVWLGLFVLAGGAATAAQEAGPAAQQTDPVVRLGRPAEGETFYSGPSSLLYTIPVNGWAFSSSYSPDELAVRLEILQADSVLASQTLAPKVDGSFTFYAVVNPENFLDPTLQEHDGCFLCHFSTTLELPPGPGVLRVTVTDPAGNQSTAERRISTDHSASVEVPVRVVLDGNPELPLEGVEVSASTRLYLWRTRNARVAVNADGLGFLAVEALSQEPTHYIFQVKPHTHNGVQYHGVEPVEVTLLPGLTAIPEVTLRVWAGTGAIRGQVSAPRGAKSVNGACPGFPPAGWRVRTGVGSGKWGVFFRFDANWQLSGHSRPGCPGGCQAYGSGKPDRPLWEPAGGGKPRAGSSNRTLGGGCRALRGEPIPAFCLGRSRTARSGGGCAAGRRAVPPGRPAGGDDDPGRQCSRILQLCSGG